MRKKLAIILAVLSVFAIVGTIAGCSAINNDPNVVAFQGTVQYIKADGGFFGLVSNSGVKYDATNLSPEYRLDGLQVRVQGNLVKNQTSPQHWGTPIKIVQIIQASACG